MRDALETAAELRGVAGVDSSARAAEERHAADTIDALAVELGRARVSLEAVEAAWPR